MPEQDGRAEACKKHNNRRRIAAPLGCQRTDQSRGYRTQGYLPGDGHKKHKENDRQDQRTGCDRRDHTQSGRNALAAAEPQRWGKEMPGKGGRPGNNPGVTQ